MPGSPAGKTGKTGALWGEDIHDRVQEQAGGASHRWAPAGDGSDSATAGLVPGSEPQSGQRSGAPCGGGFDPRSTPEDTADNLARYFRRRAEVIAAREIAAAAGTYAPAGPTYAREVASATEAALAQLEEALCGSVKSESLKDDLVELALAAGVAQLAETAGVPQPSLEPEATSAPAAMAPATAPPAAEPDPEPPILPDPALPLDLYLAAAIEGEGAWMEAQDKAGAVQWKAGFHFIRLCRAHPDLAELQAVRALKKVRRVLEGGGTAHETLCGCFGDLEGMLDCSAVDLPARWLSSWSKVRFIPGESVLARAASLADHYPLQPVEDAPDLPGYGRLFSVVGWLSWVRGDDTLFLPVRALARYVPCAPRTVGTYLKQMEATGALRLVKKYPPSMRKATEYEFLLRSRYVVLTDGPPPG